MRFLERIRYYIDNNLWRLLPPKMRHAYQMLKYPSYRALHDMNPRYFDIGSWDNPLNDKPSPDRLIALYGGAIRELNSSALKYGNKVPMTTAINELYKEALEYTSKKESFSATSRQ
jgi:hypothetical protein